MILNDLYHSKLWSEAALFSNNHLKFGGFWPKNVWSLLFYNRHIWKHSCSKSCIEVPSGLKALPDWLYQFKKCRFLTKISKGYLKIMLLLINNFINQKLLLLSQTICHTFDLLQFVLMLSLFSMKQCGLNWNFNRTKKQTMH